MKNTFKFASVLMFISLLTLFSCSEEEPIPINLQNLEVTIDENPAVGQVIGTIQSDSNNTLTYTITTQTPAGALSIDSAGELTVANAALFDFETNPVITATVAANEAVNDATVTINLTNLEVTVQNLTVTIDENPTNGDVVGTVQTNGGSNFSLTTQALAGALAIDAITGEITVADATLFDFETNPVITAMVSSDEAPSTATVTVNLANVSEITIEDFIGDIDENPSNGDVIGTVQTTGGTALNFTITTQTPAGSVNIDATTGELTVADATIFDFETNPTITATVNVDDAISTGLITINLNNVNELSIQDFTATIDENSTNGTSLGIVQAAGDGTLSFSITTQTPTGALTIDASTGELTIADETLFDFETNPTITANIMVDNSVSTETAIATINLNDLIEPATVGDFRDGGVVFWVDPTDNTHGLVVSLNNQSSNAPWGCSGTITGATGTAIGTGETNTAAIVASGCAISGSAVEIVSNLNLNGYDDWFIPSQDEWLEIFANITVIGPAISANGGQTLTNGNWSSTEGDSTNAIWVNITSIIPVPKNSTFLNTRAIRAF